MASQVRPTTPQLALPFLEDIDRIIAQYVAQKKKKTRSSKNSSRDSAASSEDDGPEKIKSRITSSILKQLHADNDSFSSSQIIESLKEVSSLSPEALLSNLRMHRNMGQKIGDHRRPDHEVIVEEHLPTTHSTDTSRVPTIQPNNVVERIERLKQLEELRIRQIMASTAVEIALEMEREATAELQQVRCDVEQARKESGELTDIIQQVEAASISSVGTDRIERLQQLQELRIKHITASTTTEIALEMERQASEKLQQAVLQVKQARSEGDQLDSAILQVQHDLEMMSPTTEICKEGESPNAVEPNRLKATDVDASKHSLDHGPDDNKGRPNEFCTDTHFPPDAHIAATPSNSEESDSDGARHIYLVATDGDSSNGCLCSRLSMLFATAEDWERNYISCHCGESRAYDCHLQLDLPMPQPVEFEYSVGRSIEAFGSSRRRISETSGTFRKTSLSPLRQGSRRVVRRRSIGGAMGLFRMSLRDEQCVER